MPSPDRFAAILVAAGRGARMGGPPKQFRALAGRPVLAWSAAAFLDHPACAALVVVHPPGGREETRQALWPLDGDARVRLTEGGDSRTLSVRNGLACISEDEAGAILIHDAARPGLCVSDIETLLATLSDADMTAPCLPVADALRRIGPNGIQSLDRTGVHRVQTPQAFRTPAILSAYEALPEDGSADDDLDVGARSGLRFLPSEGSERLSKLTYPEDFARMARLLFPETIRTGQGFDVHAFEPGDQVTLCGVAIPHDARLAGHSDADVAWHALTDAILGAAALGDIGDHFPPSDPQWKGAPSERFLAHARTLIEARGGRIVHVDLTVICEAPKVKPHREAMRAETARVLGLDPDRVSVKATTTEGLGFTGRREGIAAMASASIALSDPLA